jgi:hypothetical protein
VLQAAAELPVLLRVQRRERVREQLQVQVLLRERVLRVLRERVLQVSFRIRHRRSRLQGFLYHKWDKT